MKISYVALSVGTEPPKEILFFKSGWNDTQKGKFLFDTKAAKDVMDAYQRHGVDCMIDLEHLSIDAEAPNYDPDARAWYNLEVRNGELWAVNVEWTPDGKQRLAEKKQRYISPFFEFDPKTKRIKAVFNAAMCAVPATNETPALIAASLHAAKKFGSLNNEVPNMNKIYAALGLDEGATEEDALAAIKALSDGGGDDEDKDEKGEGALMKKLRKALKLADDSSDDEVMSALSKLTGGEDEDEDKEKLDSGSGDRGGWEHDGGPNGTRGGWNHLDDKKELSALAKKSPKLYGELIALRANASSVNERIAKLEKAHGQTEVDQFIQANIKKIPRNMEAWARSQSIQVLSGFVAVAQPTREEAHEPPRKDADPDQATLTSEDLAIAKLSGVAPDVVLAERKKELKEKRERQHGRAS